VVAKRGIELVMRLQRLGVLDDDQLLEVDMQVRRLE
jgi:hypothetical protein